MHASSALRIKPRVDLSRHGFQSVRRTRVSTPVENSQAQQTLDLERQVQSELDREVHYPFRSRPPPVAVTRL